MKAGAERDYRLDFCRGLALIVIFIDHVPGNPLSNWTLRNYAFCDAAEVFILISGISSYLAYGPKFDRLGFFGGTTAIARRWLRIYCAHLILFFSVAASIGVASRFFTSADYASWLELRWFFDSPRKAVVALLSLRYLARYLDILPLYLIFLAAAPGLIFLVKRDPRALILGSALVYIATRLTGLNLSAGGHGWYFNPFAWQLLYTIGIVVGHLGRTAPSAFPRSERWLGAAIAFIVFAFVAAAPWNGQWVGLPLFNRYLCLWPAEKTFLAPLRVLNVLALAYVFAFFVSPQAAMFRSKLAAPFMACGRNALPIYAVGVVLSCVGHVALTETSGAGAVHAAVNLLGILSLFSLAGVLDWSRTQPRLTYDRVASFLAGPPLDLLEGA